jgi:hypothetical protein
MFALLNHIALGISATGMLEDNDFAERLTES